jgi:hypothetical protein
MPPSVGLGQGRFEVRLKKLTLPAPAHEELYVDAMARLIVARHDEVSIVLTQASVSGSAQEPRRENYARSLPTTRTATTIPVAMKSAQQVWAVFLGALRKILDSPTSRTSRLHREPRTSKHLKCTAR